MDEVGRLLPLAEQMLQRVQRSYDAAQHPDEEISAVNREELRLELVDLRQTVTRLVRAASSMRIEVYGQPRCDRCGGPTTVYGDCLGGSHIATPIGGR